MGVDRVGIMPDYYGIGGGLGWDQAVALQADIWTCRDVQRRGFL